MTRIIAGVAKGRRLQVPAGGARPTTDRVRESLFASLDHLLGGFAGLSVLDLYAGSGALGLEAISRGATRAVLVERDRPTAAVARRNAAVVGGGAVRVVTAGVHTFLGSPADPAEAPFDLVLADPPYTMAAAELEAILVRLAEGWLARDAVVVVERPTRGGAFAWPSGLAALRESRYGSTTLWYGRAAPEGEDP
ncbi:MAG: 16S rRNA (guanine(966)-N(2))-methyltransferase RsmD [Candidatus Nanopelagicales bacterium]|nr:16S rRNA (guanine(966)-N(2))-methyltransferase RsmD [Candidatus Nanopelagicales bacterium]